MIKNNNLEQQLLEEVTRQMQAKGITVDLTISDVPKNNGVYKTAITASKDELGCNIYLDSFIESISKGNSTISEEASAITEVLEKAIENADETHLASLASEALNKPDLSQLRIQIVNKNLNAEMLKDTPHRIINDDLAIIARMEILPHGFSVIHNNHLERFAITPTELIEKSIENSSEEGYTVTSMKEMLSKTMDLSPADAKLLMPDSEAMYVITNKSGIYGAAGIFIDRQLRQEVADLIKEDYYILPSSISEVICIRASQIDPESAAAMIDSVNQELRPEEVLSDHPYLVNSETLVITNPMMAEREVEAAREKQHAFAHL